MTEEEARTKACPFARSRDRGGESKEFYLDGVKCLASGCMAWRFNGPASKDGCRGMTNG